MKTYIGIDNGTTGFLSAIYGQDILCHMPIPTKKELSYTKIRQYITRIDVPSLYATLVSLRPAIALMERPMVNPTRWKASMSAIRALEATLVSLEMAGVAYTYVDSKIWQKELLPANIASKGLSSAQRSKLLKHAAIDIARRLFPDIKTKDADSLLIMEYAKRKGI